MNKLSKEFWVGLLLLSVLALLLVFGSLLGMLGTFSRDARFAVLYSFAGGVEVGSAVRVSGVKVGKVESIEFIPPTTVDAGDPASLRITISVAKRALGTIRKDSRFYVNMAGIIGERYIEITPGSGEPVAPGSVVRGVDPPRIDQLLSQGYNVFGRVAEFLEKKEGTISEFIDQLSHLLTDANEFLKGKENRKAFFTLISNLSAISSQLRDGLNDPEGKLFFQRLSTLLKRAEQMDEKTLRKFLQEEGIRARIF